MTKKLLKVTVFFLARRMWFFAKGFLTKNRQPWDMVVNSEGSVVQASGFKSKPYGF